MSGFRIVHFLKLSILFSRKAKSIFDQGSESGFLSVCTSRGRGVLNMKFIQHTDLMMPLIWTHQDVVTPAASQRTKIDTSRSDWKTLNQVIATRFFVRALYVQYIHE